MSLLVGSVLIQLQEFSGKETAEARRKRKYREKFGSVENTEVETDSEAGKQAGNNGTMSHGYPLITKRNVPTGRLFAPYRLFMAGGVFEIYPCCKEGL